MSSIETVGNNKIFVDLENVRASIAAKQSEGTAPRYEQMVLDLFKQFSNPAETYLHSAVGMSGEAGEILDIVKKMWAYEQPLDEAKVLHLIEELGDIRFYYQAMLNLLNVTDEQIQASNIAKLMKRYPGGVYSNEHAKARLDKEGE